MSISISGISSAYIPESNAYITEAAANMQSEINKTEGMVNAIGRAAEKEDPKALMEACQSFESYFIQLMFKEMRRTVPEATEGMFAKSNAEKIFRDMLDEHMAILSANSGGIGLAAFMFKQMQGVNSGT